MNIKYITFVSLVLMTLLYPSYAAHAGILEWIGGKESAATTPEKSWSLDSFYALIRTDGTHGQTDILANASVIQDSTSVKQTTSTMSSKTVKRSKKILVVEASGYSSTVDQTDSTPFITAKGTYVRDGIIAANMLPFGTLVKIPSAFGDKIFVVEDRMNRRYQNHIDIWFADHDSAMEFGRRTVTIEVL
jgi:3D (Asp-Asp-Asp) domain-containing protein